MLTFGTLKGVGCGEGVKPLSQKTFEFLPRCMECRRGLAMIFLSVLPSVKCVDFDKTKEKSVQILYHWGLKNAKCPKFEQ